MEISSLRFALNSLSVSPDFSSIICGGREILKVLSIKDFAESRNLRIGKSNLNYSTQDLAWHTTEPDWVLSAAKNSCIVLWNLKKTGANTLEKLYKGHTNVVNRVKWHPSQPDIFISAAQDGVLRIWDRRNSENAVMFFKCNSEGARDVSFSEKTDNMIGASFDSGAVQIIDWRKESVVLKINAHKRSALSVDWHPIWPDRIASGGADKSIKIWNSLTGDAIYKIQAPEAVARVKWFPTGPKMIASASHSHDNNLYVWNIESPVLPDLVYKGHSQPIKDFIFQSVNPEFVITCSDDGCLIKQPINSAYCPKNDRQKSILAVSATNTVASAFSHGTKSQINFIKLGNITSEVKQLADSYQLKGELEATCETNSKVSEKNSGVWKAISKLSKIHEDPSSSWLAPLIEDSFTETVEYHAEKGDVQTSACISSVLGLKGPMKEYSELLTQLQMTKLAVKLPISHPNLEFYFRCKCGKPIEDNICNRCSNLAECSICGSVVKGLYSWCQGCGHGGHAAHMSTWFKNNACCPTGCGHSCTSLEV